MIVLSYLVQAHATEETERANTAEAEVGRLGQQLQDKSSEGQGWQQQLQQAQQDLSAASVPLTLTRCFACLLILCLAPINGN